MANGGGQTILIPGEYYGIAGLGQSLGQLGQNLDEKRRKEIEEKDRKLQRDLLIASQIEKTVGGTEGRRRGKEYLQLSQPEAFASLAGIETLPTTEELMDQGRRQTVMAAIAAGPDSALYRQTFTGSAIDPELQQTAAKLGIDANRLQLGQGALQNYAALRQQFGVEQATQMMSSLASGNLQDIYGMLRSADPKLTFEEMMNDLKTKNVEDLFNLDTYGTIRGRVGNLELEALDIALKQAQLKYTKAQTNRLNAPDPSSDPTVQLNASTAKKVEELLGQPGMAAIVYQRLSDPSTMTEEARNLADASIEAYVARVAQEKRMEDVQDVVQLLGNMDRLGIRIRGGEDRVSVMMSLLEGYLPPGTVERKGSTIKLTDAGKSFLAQGAPTLGLPGLNLPGEGGDELADPAEIQRIGDAFLDSAAGNVQQAIANLEEAKKTAPQDKLPLFDATIADLRRRGAVESPDTVYAAPPGGVPPVQPSGAPTTGSRESQVQQELTGISYKPDLTGVPRGIAHRIQQQVSVVQETTQEIDRMRAYIEEGLVTTQAEKDRIARSIQNLRREQQSLIDRIEAAIRSYR